MHTGGPGSGKGKIISELLEEQSNGELISTELLILDQLPHKVSNAIKLNSTKDVTGELLWWSILYYVTMTTLLLYRTSYSCYITPHTGPYAEILKGGSSFT